MGLDMYLSRKTFIPQDKRTQIEITGIDHAIDSAKVEFIVEEAGYWRKANAIHKWFVEHVQDGNDNCGTYYVSRQKLQELLETVDRVLDSCELVAGKVYNGTRYENDTATEIWEDGKLVKDPTLAQALLPTSEGFFFGSTQYDQYYVEDLKETQRILTAALGQDAPDSDFEYSSSW